MIKSKSENVPKEMRETYKAIIKLTDGFARRMPRELQEMAYQKGLIPYVPEDGPDET